MAKVIDVFTYNGEADILEIRLNILNDFVDEFIIVEAPTTFSGKPKPLYYEEQKERFSKWAGRIKYFVIDEQYTDEERELARSSPNTIGATHWKHEFLQKESIKKALTHLDDEDFVIVGDVDEIWRPIDLRNMRLKKTCKLELLVYTYYLNNRSSEVFAGPVIAKYKKLKKYCLNHFRTNPGFWDRVRGGGWHFTSMAQELPRKLTDSYTKETYASDEIMANLRANIDNNKDFLGRSFTYTVDESDWPQYLKDNKEKYKHLCK
jgi:beta-1,4-mannosyl-glycoprotein beta-1,4-N-acetylglucosaminyltransferase